MKEAFPFHSILNQGIWKKKGAVRGGAYTLNFLAYVNTTRAVKKEECFHVFITFCFYKEV